MLILHPEQSRSTFFKVLPFLTSDKFESFRGEMRSALLGAKDPMENNLDVVVPGLVRWHRSHQDAFLQLNERIKKMKEDFMSRIEDVSKETKMDRLKSQHINFRSRFRNCPKPILIALSLISTSSQI